MNSYASIYQLGHKALTSQDFLGGPVLIEEKIDGSSLSWKLSPQEGGTGVQVGEYYLRCRSKGAELNLLAPEKMFLKAIEEVQSRAHLFILGWTYRAEYLMRPKHNALAYDRVPRGHLIIFDIDRGNEDYLSWEEKAECAVHLDLEVVPKLFHGVVHDTQVLRSLLETPSILGGQKVEGIVIKRYDLFGPDKKVLMAKFVSEDFKEVHAREWKLSNPKSGDILDMLIQKYHTSARWQKAVQHLQEAGKLQGAPQDIGLLFKEVPADIAKEEAEAIKETLFQWAWPKITRGVTAGLAEWYKQRLLEQSLSQPSTESKGEGT